MAEAAEMISAAAGRTITYRDTDPRAVDRRHDQYGMPAEYAQVLRPLTATLASGNGARPNSDILDVTGTAPSPSPSSPPRPPQSGSSGREGNVINEDAHRQP
jgi:hypothetical protein